MNVLELRQGDCLDVLKRMPSNYADSLVTDPPAGIAFMGKEWDKDKGGRDAWVTWMTGVMGEAMRVLKPGAHGLVWALPRTSHWTATALENAGFEVRDVVMHLFGTGFPKSHDISKAIDKAAGIDREIIGTQGIPGGGLGSGIADSTGSHKYTGNILSNIGVTEGAKQWQGWGTSLKPASEHWILVRKPLSEKTVAANVLKHGTGAINIDGCRIGTIENGRFPANLILDNEDILGNNSRFFYVAKASKSDKGVDNTHPTVKSTALMGYLIKLVTPPGGVVLDPFMGSGSTGVSAVRQGFSFVGIEQEPEYFDTATKRIKGTQK
jgi:site-specific DNA-methyltransferase (adenine-specific)